MLIDVHENSAHQVIASEMVEYIRDAKPHVAADLEVGDEPFLHPVVDRSIGNFEVFSNLMLAAKGVGGGSYCFATAAV